MKYTVYSRPKSGVEGQPPTVGIEVQPPLTNGAVEGLIKILTKSPAGSKKGEGHIANSATMTRSDLAGTGLIIHPNEILNLDHVTIARTIGTIIDPCGIHEIEFVPYNP